MSDFDRNPNNQATDTDITEADMLQARQEIMDTYEGEDQDEAHDEEDYSDTDTAPNTDDGPTVTEWDHRHFREVALNLSAASIGASGSADAILAAAERFHAFIMGTKYDPATKYPYRDSQNQTWLAENIMVSPDGNIMAISLPGQPPRIYRYDPSV